MKEKPIWRDSGWFFEGHTLFVYIENTNVHASEGVGSPYLLVVYYGTKGLCGGRAEGKILCKKNCTLFLHDHSGCMVIPRSLQRQFQRRFQQELCN
jgi:hypothetical protein